MAIEAEELATISRSIRTAGQETAGEFRQAANANNANLSRIVKDISNTFKAQREDIADLHNVLEEMVSESQQTGNKIDSLNSLFRESLEIQNAMQTQLSNVTRNTKILSGDIERLNRNIMNTTSSGLLGSITGIGKSVAEELKLLGLAGAAAGAGYVAGGMGGGGGDYKAGAGEISSGQKVVSGLMQRGFSKEESSAIAGNIAAESGFKTGVTNAIGAFGLMQWLGSRKKQLFEFAQSQNKNASDLNVQLDFIKKELKGGGQETEAFNRTVKESGGDVSKMAYLFGKYVERPADWELAQSAKKRQGVATQLYGSDISSESVASQTSPTAIPASPTTPGSASSAPEAIPSATDPRTERIVKEGGHGPISGVAHEKHAEKTEGSAALPSGDIVALGHALEKMGVKISEHPSFGGVSPTAHGKNSAHYDGNAIDINATSGNRIEAQDPVTGPMFDRLAAQLQAAGYTVLWKVRNHYDHIHAQIGGKGIRGGHSAVGGEQGVTPGQTYSEHTPSSNIPAGESKQTSTGPVSGGESTMAPPGPIPIPMSPQAASPISSIMPMASMVPPMMGGGLGGIAGMLLPMIASTIQSEMVSAPSTPALNTQMVNQAAVSSQAAQQTVQESQSSFFNPTVNSEPNRMHSSDTSGFAYNMPGDIAWPDWAGMLGGMHWEEMKNYKKNMAWG